MLITPRFLSWRQNILLVVEFLLPKERALRQSSTEGHGWAPRMSNEVWEDSCGKYFDIIVNMA